MSLQQREILKYLVFFSISGDGIAIKGQAYGIRSIRVDGNDALAVYSAIRAARQMAIKEQRPILVEVKFNYSVTTSCSYFTCRLKTLLDDMYLVVVFV